MGRNDMMRDGAGDVVSNGRLDVLVVAEEIARVVAVLDRYQPVIDRRAVGLAHALLAFVT